MLRRVCSNTHTVLAVLEALEAPQNAWPTWPSTTLSYCSAANGDVDVDDIYDGDY